MYNYQQEKNTGGAVRRNVKDDTKINIKVDRVILEQVESFQFLGQLKTEKEIRRRIDIAETKF